MGETYSYSTVTWALLLAGGAWFGLGSLWEPAGQVIALVLVAAAGFALAHAEERRARAVMVVERSLLPNGAGVLTNATQGDTEGVLYLTVAVDESGLVVASRQATDERTARRNHKELEARVG